MRFSLMRVAMKFGDRRPYGWGSRRAAAAAKFLTGLLVFSGCLIFTVGQSRAEKMVIAWSAVSALNSPSWVMNEAGLLKQEGLDMELVYIASSPTVARATLAGDIVLSGANSQVIVDVGLSGGDLVAMGAITNVVAFYVMAVPEVKHVQELKGKTVGVTRFGASTDFGMRMLLTKYGLEPVKDVPFVQIGGMPELAAAISKKTIYAAPMSYPMGLRRAASGH
jgi:NitT/TauT family transport system substrate-binding protein